MNQPPDASPSGGITTFWLHPNCSVGDAEPGTPEILHHNRKHGFYPLSCFSTSFPHHGGGQAWQLALSPALPSHRFSKSPLAQHPEYPGQESGAGTGACAYPGCNHSRLLHHLAGSVQLQKSRK